MNKITIGIYAGLFGGAVFGVMMAVAGMYPMIASLLGLESGIAGFALHFVISAVIGAVFGYALDGMVREGPGMGLGVGAAYGLVWWVIGPLLIMPAVMGMPLFAVEAQMGSLFGHVIFGMTMGMIYYLLRAQEPAQ